MQFRIADTFTASLLLAYVDHHDDAYRWAARRQIETHPTTGAAQLVELRERVEEIVIPRPAEAAADVRREQYLPPLFQQLSEPDLVSIGVPRDWLDDVRNTSEDNFFDVAGEATEAHVLLTTFSRTLAHALKIKPDRIL